MFDFLTDASSERFFEDGDWMPTDEEWATMDSGNGLDFGDSLGGYWDSVTSGAGALLQNYIGYEVAMDGAKKQQSLQSAGVVPQGQTQAQGGGNVAPSGGLSTSMMIVGGIAGAVILAAVLKK